MHNIQSPRPDTDETIEAEIRRKGLTAARITPEHIDATIASKVFHVFPETQLTVCVLTLQNGFTVTGESACASPANFNAEIGERVALGNAKQKIWALEGYLLKQRLSQVPKTDIEAQRAKMDAIARVAHEVNRAYCQALGDHSQPAWDNAPPWQRESARMGADLHMSGDFGPEASHAAWLKNKVEEGWVYGAVKDPELKRHPCIVSFAELPREQQAKDFLFRAVVHALRD